MFIQKPRGSGQGSLTVTVRDDHFHGAHTRHLREDGWPCRGSGDISGKLSLAGQILQAPAELSVLSGQVIPNRHPLPSPACRPGWANALVVKAVLSCQGHRNLMTKSAPRSLLISVIAGSENTQQWDRLLVSTWRNDTTGVGPVARDLGYFVILQVLVRLRYLMKDKLTPLPPPPPSRKEPSRPQPTSGNQGPSSSTAVRLCQEPCQSCPLRYKRLSHSFLQIFILLKSPSLPGVLRLKTTASNSCCKWECKLALPSWRSI